MEGSDEKKSGMPEKELKQKLDKVHAKLEGLRQRKNEIAGKLAALNERNDEAAAEEARNWMQKMEEIDVRVDKLKTKKEHLERRLTELQQGAGCFVEFKTPAMKENTSPVGGRESEGNRSDGSTSSSPALCVPAHLLTRIFSQLDCTDLLSCSLVCKQWYRDATELREGWKNEYLEACYLYGLCIKRDTHPSSSTCSIRGLHSWCP